MSVSIGVDDAVARASDARAAIRTGPRIGVLTPLTGGLFWGEIIAGIVQTVEEAGGSVTLIQTLDAGQTVGSYRPTVGTAAALGGAHLDGFVALLRSTDDEYLRRIRETGTPVVVVSEHTRDVDAASVTVDNVSGIRESVRHLADHGHTRIGFVGHDGHSDAVERYDAYRAAMADHGLAPFDRVLASDDMVQGGRDAAAAVVAAGWTAVVAATDRNAFGLISGLRDLGVTVPRDVAVIGFDDLESSWRHDPPLTTSRQRFTDLGVVAAQVLLAEVGGGPVEHRRHTVPTALVQRASCGCQASAAACPGDLGAVVGAMVGAVCDIVAAGGDGPPGGSGDGLRAAVDATIARSVESALTVAGDDEGVRTFLHLSIERLTRAAAAADGAVAGAGPLLGYAAAQVAATLVQTRSTAYLARMHRLLLEFDKQFDIGVTLLAHGDVDPVALGWLAEAGITGGCLGLWDGRPEDGRLVIVGVHAEDGRLERYRGTRCTVQEFPPRELIDLADIAAGEVTLVIPVRGVSGDHGLLCVTGTSEREFAVTRNDYDHWAAQLGERLREEALLEEIRQSEERYALAARAANDGLWEWRAGTGEVYLSGRGRELMAVQPDEAVTVESLCSRFHPDDRAAVMAAVTRAVDVPGVAVEVEGRLGPRDGTTPWVLVRALGVERDGLGTGLVGSVSDIDPRKALEERLRSAALVDEVTGLPNRRFLLDRLRHEIARSDRREGGWFAVLFLDLDGFKLINNSLGHLAGDELLRVVGDRLRATLRVTDTAARFGGDEFAVLLVDPVPEDLLLVAERIQERIAAPVALGHQQVRLTASIGITTSETGYGDPEDVLRDADTAMYRAKEREHGAVCLFDLSMHQSALERLQLRGEVAAALANGEFVVHYQPIVDLTDPTVRRFEALVRWQHPTRGLVGPAEFLPAMEASSAIVALDRQVLACVCEQVVAWRALTSEPVQVSVNVSHRSFWSAEFPGAVRAALAAHGVPPRSLCLELTEGVIMTDPDEARRIMAELRDLGVGLHIDDFGTGHSSLHLLRTFPLDTLKIAGPFVRELTEIEESAALVRAIITMARALGMSTIAEWVETPQQGARLSELGCTLVQGWLFARALPAEEATAVLGTRLLPALVPDR